MTVTEFGALDPTEQVKLMQKAAEQHAKQFAGAPQAPALRLPSLSPPQPVTSHAASAREPRARRTVRRGSSRGSPARDDDPEPEPLAPHRCLECGEAFPPGTSSRRTFHDACGNRARQRRHKTKTREDFRGRWLRDVRERDRVAKAPTRIPMREATRLVPTGRRFEVSQDPGELGRDSRPMNGRLHWPRSFPMREVIVQTVDLEFPELALGRLMEGADTDNRYWEQVTA